MRVLALVLVPTVLAGCPAPSAGRDSGPPPIDAGPVPATYAIAGSPLLELEILCDHLPDVADPSQLRALFRGAGSSDPAFLQLFDCPGTP